MTHTTDGMAIEVISEARAFRAAIVKWAKGYASLRSGAPLVDLGVDAARADLQLWSGRYFNAQSEAAALAAIASAGRQLPRPPSPTLH